MNIASAEMLQNSLQNLGNTFSRQRQMEVENAWRQAQIEAENKRTSVDQSFREAQMAHYNQIEDAASRRADADEKRIDQQNQPKIQADLKGSDGTQMTFTGTPQQLDAMIASAKQQGKSITVESKKSFAAQFNIGGSQFSFTDQDAADKFAAGMKEKGIDVYAPQAPNVTTTPGGQELVTDAKGHVIKGAPAPTPGFTTQTVRQVPPPIGSTNGPMSLTNTTTRIPSFAMPPSAPTATPPSGLPVIGSQEEYDALPVGAKYIDSNGRQGTKRGQSQPIPDGGGFQISMPGQQ